MNPAAEESDGRHDSSYYKFNCVCGKKIISESAECSCPACGRQIRIEWRAVYQSPAPAVAQNVPVTRRS